jgi:hypothetical protein
VAAAAAAAKAAEEVGVCLNPVCVHVMLVDVHAGTQSDTAACKTQPLRVFLQLIVCLLTRSSHADLLFLQAKAREEAARIEQQQQQQQAAAAAAAPSAAGATPVSADPHLKSTAAAVEYEQLLQRKLSEAEAAAAEITSRPELKQQRRALEKQITMAVSQISGTQQQVGVGNV